MNPTATDVLVMAVATCLLLMTGLVVLTQMRLLFHLERTRKQEAEHREALVDKIQQFAERNSEKVLADLAVLSNHSRERQQAATTGHTQNPVDREFEEMGETMGQTPDIYAINRG